MSPSPEDQIRQKGRKDLEKLNRVNSVILEDPVAEPTVIWKVGYHNYFLVRPLGSQGTFWNAICVRLVVGHMFTLLEVAESLHQNP